MKHKTSHFFIFILLLTLKGYATNYYVAPNGLDSQTGSLSSPFLTIQHGSNQLLPGDSLFIRGGIYFEKIYCNASGTLANPISITNYQNEVPIIDGTGVIGNDLFVINSENYLTIKGLIFQNNYLQEAKGIYILNDGIGIKILHCTVRNIGWTTNPNADPYSVSPTGQAHGILVNGRTTAGIKNITISDCHVHNIISGNSEALTLVGNVSDFMISRDTVRDTKNIGIVVAGHYSWAVDSGVAAALNQTRNGFIYDCVTYGNRRISNIDAPAGIYADGAKNVLISRNKSYNNGNGMSVGCENAGFNARNIFVVNNVIYGNDNQGIYFGSNAANLDSSILKNNTIVENGTIGNFYSEVSLQNSTNCRILQNIIIASSTSHYAISIFGYNVMNLLVDNNLAFRYNGNLTNIYVEGSPSQFSPTNSIFANPRFIDSLITNPNFSLRDISPAINQGLSAYSYLDSLDNVKNKRLVNGKLDHGALESIDGGCPDILTLDNSYLLQGVFTAKNEVKINSSNHSIDKMQFYTPKVTITGTFNNGEIMEIISTGCQ